MDDQENKIAAELEINERKMPKLRILCLVTTIFYIIVYINNVYSREVTRDPPLPLPIFSRARSIVEDEHEGNLNFLSRRSTWSREGFVVLMYYAPWCARSLRVKNEFSRAALHLKEEVKFFAINCWIGKCRELIKLKRFPLITIVFKNLDNLEYQGEFTERAIIEFVNRVVKPYDMYIESNAFPPNDYTVLAYLNLKRKKSLKQFYESSILMIKYDTSHEIQVNLIMNRYQAKLLNIRRYGVYLMDNINAKLTRFKMSPRNANFTAENIVGFVRSNKRKELVTYISLNFIKSNTLSKYLKASPSVILFHARDDLNINGENRKMLRRLAMEYSRCDANKISKELSIKKHKDIFKNQQRCLSYISLSGNQCQVCIASVYTACNVFSAGNTCQSNYWQYNVISCRERSIESRQLLITRIDHHHRDRNISTAEKIDNKLVKEFRGYSCKLNRTLQFYEMNIETSKHLLDNLGIYDIEQVAIIVDVQNESTYVLRNISYAGITTFVKAFHGASLQRHLKSKPLPPTTAVQRSTNCINSTVTVTTTTVTVTTNTTDTEHNSKRSSVTSERIVSKYIINVVEVNTATFHSLVLNNTKDVVVYYYSKWCGFCKQFSVVYLELARHFHKIPVLFTRIEADKNDLPWQYTMNNYPSIVYYKRSGRSYKFPGDIRRTKEALIEFINSHIPHNLEYLIMQCDNKCKKEALNIARIKIRKLKDKKNTMLSLPSSNQTYHKIRVLDKRIFKIYDLLDKLS